MNITHLECALCGLRHEARILQNLCVECGKPLLVRYDLTKAAVTLTRDALRTRDSSLWRYREVLPVEDPENIVSFGEGWTPLLKADKLANSLPLKLNLYIKDEGQNPTQSFKARGMAAAVSMARELGVKKLAVPSAGNAAGALAAYAARAGMEAHIFMPIDTPKANVIECRQTGAFVELIDGLITDCGKIVAERKEAEGWFDLSTLKEPYRVEGKKTMGYELAEQFGGMATGVRTGRGSCRIRRAAPQARPPGRPQAPPPRRRRPAPCAAILEAAYPHTLESPPTVSSRGTRRRRHARCRRSRCPSRSPSRHGKCRLPSRGCRGSCCR